MHKITRKELARRVWLEYASYHGLKDVETILATTFYEIGCALARGEQVQIIGFGTFEVKQRSSLTGINPRTGEPIEIPAHKLPIFRAGTNLKKAVQTDDNACKSF